MEAPADCLSFPSKAEIEQIHIAQAIVDAPARLAEVRAVRASFVRPAKRARVEEAGAAEEEEEGEEGEEGYEGEEEGYEEEEGSAASVSGGIQEMAL